MPIPDKIVALLDGLTLDELDALSPVRREQFRQRCQHWANLASELPGAADMEPKSMPVVMQCAAEDARLIAKEGVLPELARHGGRSYEC
jgi:hypothetical protein